ncbi:MAG: hypothetical protein EZS28_031585 [Streblomastix strix]|uniref:Uncharacterized protein n=1 Tax=Streblomastix strix TaxID=222440 RepID=A0A5J4UR13_9EUKA|nr:MAG: hypothetical protein EZS28_031585 [Streblomastix strix]
MGDVTFSAESGTVWMYEINWYNNGDIVPDKVTPTSDATPLADSGTEVAGTSNEYSRGDHQHLLQLSTSLPSKDTSVVNIGSARTYTRSDHQHPIQTVDSITRTDTTDEYYGTVAAYARNNHSHPINVQTNASIVTEIMYFGLYNQQQWVQFLLEQSFISIQMEKLLCVAIQLGKQFNANDIDIYLINQAPVEPIADEMSEEIVKKS